MNLFEQQQNEFAGRHIGPNETETREMLKTIGIDNLDELIGKTPASPAVLQPTPQVLALGAAEDRAAQS